MSLLKTDMCIESCDDDDDEPMSMSSCECDILLGRVLSVSNIECRLVESCGGGEDAAEEEEECTFCCCFVLVEVEVDSRQCLSPDTKGDWSGIPSGVMFGIVQVPVPGGAIESMSEVQVVGIQVYRVSQKRQQ